ncbi:MAG: ATP-binding cassette domain-containing protein [Legionella sp.]|nr:ATP-binding cassette domain-containing protein [Legionella sp.]
MMHKLIQFKNLGLSFPHKTCFEAFNGEVYYGSRIAIIGRNGVGKSTLLKMLHGSATPCHGDIEYSRDLCVGYLPQIVQEFQALSGGQRLNKKLSGILALNPNLLLLDEPTNHLDSHNRHSLIRRLMQYQGGLVIVSHDVELISKTTDILWHIDGERVIVFNGGYHEYQQEQSIKVSALEQELKMLSRLKKGAHQTLMKAQERNKSTRIRGEKHINQRKWPTVRSPTKMGNAVTSYCQIWCMALGSLPV